MQVNSASGGKNHARITVAIFEQNGDQGRIDLRSVSAARNDPNDMRARIGVGRFAVD